MKQNAIQGRFCSKAAFTLIELLVVVLIIGILAAVALPQYTFAVEKTHLSEALTTMASLEKAIDAWVLENGQPALPTDLLGNEAEASGQLAIDLTGMDCSLWDGIACGNKDFLYYAGCSGNTCSITAIRLINGEQDDVEGYAVVRMKNFSNNETWHGDECDYSSEGRSVDKKICHMLESQGDGYFANEDF